MKIELKKFGIVLTSRPAGKEAFAAIRPILKPDEKKILIDFDGIISLSPSWADEFFSALRNMYGNKVKFLPSNNISVIETIKIIEK